MEKGVALDLRHTTTQVIEIVPHKSHHIVGPVEV